MKLTTEIILKELIDSLKDLVLWLRNRPNDKINITVNIQCIGDISNSTICNVNRIET